MNTKRVLAVLAVGAIPALLMVWIRTRQTTAFASIELIAYPLLFGSLGILVVYALKKHLLGESIAELNSGAGSVLSDVLWGLALTATYFALFFAFRFTLRDLLAFTPNVELLNLMLDMRQHPWLVLLWFGPVLWIGIALFEEVIRTFLLSALWKFSSNPVWTVTAVVVVSALTGIVHLGQGPYGMVTIALKSVVIGLFYFRVRRLFPLVLAHVLYDGFQVGALLLTYPSQ
jgi:membrane protease YdiL (CAAX protease family)